jgi:cell division protein FtsZ
MLISRRDFIQISGVFIAADFASRGRGWTPFPSSLRRDVSPQSLPRIIVMGIGGAGGAVLNALMRRSQPGVQYVAVQWDARALIYSEADETLLIGQGITRLTFWRARPEETQRAVHEGRGEFAQVKDGADLVFLVGGMGGGTATGPCRSLPRSPRRWAPSR